MINRLLLRQSQAAKSALSFRSISTVPVRRTSPFQVSSQSLRPLPSRLLGQRYASTESEGKQEEKESANGNGENGKPAEAENPLEKELEARKKEIIDLKDKYLRSVADFRNLQERTKKDVEAARTFAIQRFAQDLVESIDNLDRALEVVPKEKLKPEEGGANKDLVDLFSGLKMTENILMNTLKKHGLVRFDPSELVDGQPQKFDPKIHEATFMTPAEGKEDGDVLHTQSKGFMLNGRVLRAAKVGVVKNP